MSALIDREFDDDYSDETELEALERMEQDNYREAIDADYYGRDVYFGDWEE